MARPQSALTKFILSLPRDLNAKEVLAKAKAKGMKVTESNVYRVRRLAKTKAQKTAISKSKPQEAKSTASSPSTATSATKPTKPAPSAATSGTSPKAKQSKADFVRSLPSGTAATEVIKKAKAAGLSLSRAYVYLLRGAGKAKAKKKTAKTVTTRRATTPRKAASVARPIASTSSAEDLLRALGAEIGLGTAVGILTDERAKLRGVIGG